METLDGGKELLGRSILVLLLANCCYGSSHRDLLDDLMQDYPNLHIRPVKKTSTTTNVTLRPLFVNLIEMDTRNQQYTLFSYLKTVWRDEFLTWNVSAYDGTSVIFVPHDAIWTPDITLERSPDFQRYKSDSFVEIHNDGTVYWYVQAIYKGDCPVWVKWFPFDTQICYMTFLSWAYNGRELHIYPDKSIDGTQRSYLQNGVWDLLEVSVKKVTSKYTCCDVVYYNLEYRLVFHRQASFYISYIVVPVILLSLLAVTVFFLPPDNGSKLQFSITNLLALAFFEQLVADVVPPSGENTPVIDIYFQMMIVLVSLSVFATVGVINLSSRSYEPVPKWMKWMAFGKLSYILFMHDYVQMVRADNKQEFQSSQSEKVAGKRKSFYVEEFQQIIPANVNNYGFNDNSSYNDHSGTIGKRDDKRNFAKDWYLVALVVSRFFALLFCSLVIVSTVTILTYIWYQSTLEYENAIGKLRDEWKERTFFSDA